MSAPTLSEPGIASRPVRVQLSTSVATNMELFQKAQLQILDRLGCPACCSGFDIRWDTVRDFVVDNELNIHEIGGGRLGGLG